MPLGIAIVLTPTIRTKKVKIRPVGRKNSIGIVKLPIGTHDAARRVRVLIRDAWPVFSVSP